jgi:hypothetical protein
MNTQKIKCLQVRIGKIKRALLRLGDLRPGSLSKQYNVCGNATCRCKDPKHPRKHGPYFQVSYTHRGKSSSSFVKGGEVKNVRAELRNYRRFRKLTQEWIDVSLQIVKLRQRDGRHSARAAGKAASAGG